MTEKLGDFWEKKVVKSDKHFVDSLSEEKINRMKERVEEFIFAHLDFSKIKTVLDWGCGGGLFAKILSEKAEVILSDISKESIQKAESYIGKDMQAILLPEDPDEVQLPDVHIDLLFSHTVIHHFPSYNYWLKVFHIWTKKIRPAYFGLQIKIEDETSERGNYFQENNYLNALYLNEDEFKQMFQDAGYVLVNAGYKINTYKNPDHRMKVGYFVFEKNKS